ncbi:MAG TPA: hypothetical protein VHS13_06865 [Edaphobacter sp.]|nr:hypothetical protein [Edaphobacter sp.]
MPSHLPIPKSCSPRFRSQRGRVALALALLTATASAQQSSVVEKMAANEVAARQQRSHFFFVALERSVRTGGHLWKENVVETNDGPLHRLIAIDNRPLTPAEAAAEQRRIDYLVAHPDQLRRENQAHKDDEARATQLMQMLSTAYVLTPNGEVNGCTRFTFQPRPEFRPSSYQERVAHEMAGTVSVKQPDDRLCTLEATILHPVEFGYGMLGRIDQGGHFSLARRQIDPKNWKSDRISVHVTGRILMLKSLAQDQDTLRSDIRIVPQNLTLAQAAQLTRQ